MLQKSLKDRVFAERCSIESILWFHMECPKAVAKFDDPIEFKRKWRQFFAELKASSEVMLIETPEMKRVRDQYAHMPYPEDVPRRNSIEFLNEFKDF